MKYAEGMGYWVDKLNDAVAANDMVQVRKVAGQLSAGVRLMAIDEEKAWSMVQAAQEEEAREEREELENALLSYLSHDEDDAMTREELADRMEEDWELTMHEIEIVLMTMMEVKRVETPRRNYKGKWEIVQGYVRV